MAVGGSYSTKNSKTHPAISLSYDMEGVDIQQTFLAFNTVQKLMPVAQFVSGKISSNLSMNGSLGASMMPDLSTLSGKGSLVVLDGVLNEFAPMNKLASTLNIKELQRFPLKDIKALFEFSAGKVLVKPFTVKIKNIEMEVGGMHGLDQSIDYVINMKLPRELLGTQANSLVNNLASQAAAKGIPVKLSDVINLKVNLGGTIKNPQVNLNMKEAGASMEEELKQQAAEFAQARIDSAKKTVSDTLKALKEEAVKTVKDEILKQLGGQKDSAGAATDPKKRIEEAGKNVLKNIFKKKADDSDKKKPE